MKTILILTFNLFFTILAFGQNGVAAKRVANYNLNNNIAIQGYDPVSYFVDAKATKGKKEFSSTYLGVVYQFASLAHKMLFDKNPAAYEPQYGGWCAYAMGEKGEKVEINPETFKIIEGKLYLFYNAFFNNTLKEWNKNQTVLKKNADANWIKISK